MNEESLRDLQGLSNQAIWILWESQKEKRERKGLNTYLNAKNYQNVEREINM